MTEEGCVLLLHVCLGFDGSREIADELKCELYTYDKYSHAVYDEASDIKKIVYDFMMRNYD